MSSSFFCMFRSWVQLTLIVCRLNPSNFQVSFANGYGFALALILHSALTILWVTGMITRGLEFVPAHPALSDAFPYKPLLYHQWLDGSDICIIMERVDQRVTIQPNTSAFTSSLTQPAHCDDKVSGLVRTWEAWKVAVVWDSPLVAPSKFPVLLQSWKS